MLRACARTHEHMNAHMQQVWDGMSLSVCIPVICYSQLVCVVGIRASHYFWEGSFPGSQPLPRLLSVEKQPGVRARLEHGSPRFYPMPSLWLGCSPPPGLGYMHVHRQTSFLSLGHFSLGVLWTVQATFMSSAALALGSSTNVPLSLYSAIFGSSSCAKPSQSLQPPPSPPPQPSLHLETVPESHCSSIPLRLAKEDVVIIKQPQL